MTSSLSGLVQNLIGSVTTQFNFRTQVEGKKQGIQHNFTLTTNIDRENVLWLTFTGEETHNVNIPLPFMRNGIQLIQHNEVVRAVCPLWLEQEQQEIDYLAAIYSILLTVPRGIVSDSFVKATPFLQRVVYSSINKNTSIIIYQLQRAINEFVTKMPLHETDMNSFVMNHRLIIVDPVFDEIRSPAQRLEYQVEKANKYFSRGWTPIGLSDGVLADKNYILKVDLRKLSPFAIRFHNPQRNLYSTLGMKGDEYPRVRSRSMQNLMNQGISRKGWNLFTAFVDIPDVFEDQIIVDKRLASKFTTEDRRFQVFGTLTVKKGDKVKYGQTIGYAPDGEPMLFKVLCDSAKVTKISKAVVAVGGVATPVFNVVIEYKRNFKDGTKLTNLHGNKGVIRLMDLGYAIDPKTGKKRKLDVIVGAKTVGKRKNYGQVLEALINCLLEADNRQISGWQHALLHEGHITKTSVEPLILEDDWYQSEETIRTNLSRCGYPDGIWECHTYIGKLNAICGTVFWGCIKQPEDQIWQGNATINRNTKEIRTAGLKFSHVELRAFQTRFGVNNPILDEIMSYVQGTENVNEELWMIRSKMGEFPNDKPVIRFDKIRPVDQKGGTIVPAAGIAGTVVDEDVFSNGFIYQLPLPYQTALEANGDVVHEGPPLDFNNMGQKHKITDVYTTDKLYFPSGILRKCWRHGTGKFGLSDLGVIINNVVVMSHMLAADPTNQLSYQRYYWALDAYFNRLAKMMGTKRGEISTYTMAVRYPFSAKAVATLSTTLPQNTVEIHRSMAHTLRVNTGDVIIAERFPCLGFMGVRPQKVRVTDDPMCKYTIRASGNSLVSQNLDFDGDVLFLASFHTPAAKIALMKEWMNPNKICYDEIQTLNERKGKPCTKEYVLKDIGIVPFPDLTQEVHADLVRRATGIKAHTGPVIALAYNIMRIVESSDIAEDQTMKVAVEMFLEKTAQSVFYQKHGVTSLYDVVMESVCTGNVEALVAEGFKRDTTEKLCALITQKAASIGIFDLRKFHERAKKYGGSNIISTLVREFNKIYFASRASLHGIALVKALQSPATDVPSQMFKWAMAGRIGQSRTILDEIIEEEKLSNIKDGDLRRIGEMFINKLS